MKKLAIAIAMTLAADSAFCDTLTVTGGSFSKGPDHWYQADSGYGNITAEQGAFVVNAHLETADVSRDIYQRFVVNEVLPDGTVVVSHDGGKLLALKVAAGPNGEVVWSCLAMDGGSAGYMLTVQ